MHRRPWCRGIGPNLLSRPTKSREPPSGPRRVTDALRAVPEGCREYHKSVCGSLIVDSCSYLKPYRFSTLSFYCGCFLIHPLILQISSLIVLFVPSRFTVNLQNRAALTEILQLVF